MGDSSKINNIYLSPDHNILPKSGEVKDLGILMSENCDFDSHIASVAKKCSRLCRLTCAWQYFGTLIFELFF